MSDNNSGKQNNNVNNFSGLNMKAIGNYTKNAVQNFESNIVNQTNYLEKVDSKLNDKKDD